MARLELAIPNAQACRLRAVCIPIPPHGQLELPTGIEPASPGYKPGASPVMLQEHYWSARWESNPLRNGFAIRSLPIWDLAQLAGREGNDPSLAGLESAVLPLTLTTYKLWHPQKESNPPNLG